ncbi:MAG: TetR family transcriptional regulator [Rhodospirillaceae bacterium]|jgi:AcrR family transcriptional regulator|nr:TetR family transcriptional regulator [Rhodospirillaceae bacterium]MBT6117006.1 TetR family transcriptional regulator [Rhodospirillaceae bacterium]
MATETSTEDRVIDAALDLAASQGWRGLGLREIAAAAGVGLAELYDAFPGKDAILDGYARRLDRAALAGEGLDMAGEPARDRLFDTVMRRLDLMEPHKAAIAAILHDVTRDPLWAACHAPGFLRSIDWLLEAADLRAARCRGALRRAGLAAIYLDTIRVWLRDDSPDLARTMAALDRRLRQADGAMRFLARGPRRPDTWTDEAESPAAR